MKFASFLAAICMFAVLAAKDTKATLPQDPSPLSTDWQLPFDSFDSVMDPEIVAPRPLDELKSSAERNSPYLWGHPSFDYVRPLHARGGAWPYHWEVIEGPAGTTIGEFPDIDDTGTLHADPHSYSMLHVPAQPQGSVSTVVVRMRDQNWNRGPGPSEALYIELEITWQADRWLVVAPDGKPDGAGTADDPLHGQTFWDEVASQESFGDKLILLRGGDYGAINKSISLNAGTRPVVYLAAPGETPIVRNLLLQPSAADASIMGLAFDQPFERYNQYFIRVWGPHPRVTLTSNQFIGLTPGSNPGSGDGQDNPSGIMTTNPGQGNRRNHVTIARNHFSEFSGARVNFAAFITYGNARSVFEMNRLSDSAVMEGFYVKGAHFLTTVRANIVDDDVSVSDSRGGLTAMHFPGTSEDELAITGFVEHCWNYTPTGNLALLDRSASMDSIAPNPNYLYRNTGNGVLTHSKQRQFIRWNVFNNVTMGAYGVAIDTPSGRWPSAIGVWPVQNGNAHIRNDLFSDGQLIGGAARVDGYKGSRLKAIDKPWPDQGPFDGIQNTASFEALGEKTLPVAIGPAGRNRMLMVVSYQSGGNGRGQGYHLDGIYGQTGVHNQTQYDNVIISFFDDRLLPRESGTYLLESEESGTESVYAIYAEGVAQQAPQTLFWQGEEIAGPTQFNPGDPAELVVFGALPLDDTEPTPLPGQTYILQGNETIGHHGLWRTGSHEPVGIAETFEGILNAATFNAASNDALFADRFEP